MRQWHVQELPPAARAGVATLKRMPPARSRSGKAPTTKGTDVERFNLPSSLDLLVPDAGLVVCGLHDKRFGALRVFALVRVPRVRKPRRLFHFQHCLHHRRSRESISGWRHTLFSSHTAHARLGSADKTDFLECASTSRQPSGSLKSNARRGGLGIPTPPRTVRSPQAPA